MAEVDTSIYKPQPQQNPLKMISDLGGALDTLGEIEVGKASQQALDPNTGEIDRNALGRMLQQTVAGSRKAIPTFDALEKLRSAGFGADQAGLDTFQKRMAITHHLFSGVASKDKPTMDDVYDIATIALDPKLDAKKYGITMPVIMNALKQFRGPDGKPLSSAQIKQKALEIQTQAASTSEILQQHSPRYGVTDRGGSFEIVPHGTGSNPAVGTVLPKNLPPGTPVATKDGTQYLGEQPAPAPAAIVPGQGLSPADVRVGAPLVNDKPQDRVPAGDPRTPIKPNLVPTTREPPVPTGPAAGLRPGYTEAAQGIAAGSAQSANRLTEAAGGAMSRKGMLGNLEDDLTKFTSGGGANWEALAKNWLGRNLPVSDTWKKEGAILDQTSLASQEQFNKQASMIAQSQFSTIGGTGTDAKFQSAFTTSPNEALSQLGNKGIIRLLKGNEDAIIAMNQAWQKYKKANGPDTFPEFQAEFQQNFDPRTFQFKYLTKAERQKYIDNMDPADQPEFLRNLTHARKQGWIVLEAPKK